MWLFTKYGFFSAVCARQGDGGHDQPPDSDRVMVRARRRQHLEALRERCPGELGDNQVMESATTDYRYRLFVAKDAWRRVVDALVDEMDYDNFKGEVARYGGSAAYETSLRDVWEVMHSFQHADR